jgi:hypothetical protein
MFRLSVLQSQWLILALMGGLILTLGFIAAWLMMARPRSPSAQPVSGGRALLQWIPWFILVLLVGIVVFQITYAIVLHFHPPNM